MPLSPNELAVQIAELYRPAPRGHWQRRVQALLCEWMERRDVRLCWSPADAEADPVPVRFPIPGRTAPPQFIGFSEPLTAADRAFLRSTVTHVALAAELMELTVEPPDASLPPRWRQLLTQRQAEVSMLAASGLRDRDIAAQLGIAPRTVARQLQETFRRLALHSRAELAAELVLGRPPTPIHGPRRAASNR